MAKLRHNAKDNETALTILEKTRRDNPQVWDLVALQSEILRETGQLDPAVRLVEAFARANWWHQDAALALGRLYAQQGDAVRAEAALRHASRLDIHDAKALNLLAAMRVGQNRLDEAFSAQRRAVARQPDEPRQYILLSNILEKMGRGDEARAALLRAPAVSPRRGRRKISRNEIAPPLSISGLCSRSAARRGATRAAALRGRGRCAAARAGPAEAHGRCAGAARAAAGPAARAARALQRGVRRPGTPPR